MVGRSGLVPPEAAHLFERSDRAGAVAVASVWLQIAAIFGVLALVPHPVTFAIAVVALGTRQHALAVLMHESAHGLLFRTRRLNERVGEWLCAQPIATDVRRYRRHHVRHHAHTGTVRDPDRGLAEPFPCGRASLARKLLRDALGLTGLKRLLAIAAMNAELLEYTAAVAPRRLPWQSLRHHLAALVRRSAGALAINLGILALLVALGHAWLFAAWALAFVTAFDLILRVRSMAEHAAMDASADPLRNTRTTRANWLARAVLAPFAVNYHLEHHLEPALPMRSLPALHRLLRTRGHLDPALVAPGYFAVLREMARSPTTRSIHAS
ncbi:MAG TPA: fatty acid desaturase family protein [Nannocystaceae bacterium]|nr:fatty acid desaturase family protein [Nannocystaceae bacterium]